MTFQDRKEGRGLKEEHSNKRQQTFNGLLVSWSGRRRGQRRGLAVVLQHHAEEQRRLLLGVLAAQQHVPAGVLTTHAAKTDVKRRRRRRGRGSSRRLTDLRDFLNGSEVQDDVAHVVPAVAAGVHGEALDLDGGPLQSARGISHGVRPSWSPSQYTVGFR